jgi:DNA-binding GntR family transcriptional regulator
VLNGSPHYWRVSPGFAAPSEGKLTGRVPSVATIAQQYEVAKGTAERALAILRDEGLIRSVMGRGHFAVPAAER